MSIKKLLAVDLDGTFLNSKSQVTPENLAAVARLKRHGVETAVLTGRTFYEIPLEIRSCKDIEYFVFSDGAGICHSEKGLRYYCPIDKELAKTVYNALKNYDCFIELYSNGNPTVLKDCFNDEALNYYNIDPGFIPVMKKTRLGVKSLEAVLDDEAYKIEMFDIFFKHLSERQQCVDLLREQGIEIEITESMTNNLELLAKGVNKGSGLKSLCKCEKINPDDIIVAGDSKNDISAFAFAKESCAVANACDELKAVCTKVICSNDENIMVYFENHLL